MSCRLLTSLPWSTAALASYLIIASMVLASCAPEGAQNAETTSPSRSASGPNIVLITIDTLRADHLGCYGYSQSTSPRIDEFCRESVRFDTAITATPTTDPAHSSIMTGLYPANHGVLRNGWRLDDAHQTLAEVLRKVGYRTMAAVSVRHLSQDNGFGQGFEDFYAPPGGRHHVDPPAVSRQAIQWIEESEAPFFLWVHFWDPHGDYAPPATHDLFAPDTDLKNLTRFRTVRRPEGRIDHVPSAYLDRIVSLYDAEIRFTDSEVGRLLDALRAKGVYDDSFIAVSSDHGELMDEIATSHNYAFDHGEYLLDGNLRIPLMMRFPGGRHSGTVIEEQVSNMDILPSIAAHLDIELDRELDGVSLLGLLDGEPVPRKPIFLQTRAGTSKDLPSYHEYGVRTTSWKYIVEADSKTEILYDLQRDPDEKVNAKDAHPEVASRLRDELERWRRGHGPVRNQIISKEQAEALEALGYIQ